jgi:hypothetical protein
VSYSGAFRDDLVGRAQFTAVAELHHRGRVEHDVLVPSLIRGGDFVRVSGGWARVNSLGGEYHRRILYLRPHLYTDREIDDMRLMQALGSDE